jgi:2-polyprenyl-3-methyl-5-hydroxy-6-metoxy-1,4-benzoquinol methylase
MDAGTMLRNVLKWVWKSTCRAALRCLSAKDAGQLVEEHAIWRAGRDPRIGQYAVNFNNPQSLRFLIDVYPDLCWMFSHYSRGDVIRFLDIGPAFGSASGLVFNLHQSGFLGASVQVEVLDITDERQNFFEFRHPRIPFHHGRIESIPATQKWDVVYCSNAIEHMEQPALFVAEVLKRTSGYAMFVAPYKEEEPMSLDHKSSISEETFAPFQIERLRVFETAAWPTTATGVERKQVVVIVRP